MTSILKNYDDILHAKKLIDNAQRVTLLTHYNPDGDGVSACAALAHFLIEQGKSVETIYPTKLEEVIVRQPANVLINKHQQQPDLLIALDTSVYKRLYYPEAFKNIPLITIDHHRNNEIKGTVNFVTTEVSSTCELLYLLFMHWAPSQEGSHQPNITTYIAECLLYGILYDTQSFYNNATTPVTLRLAGELMQYHKADIFQLQRELYNKKPNIIIFWGHLLQTMQLSTSQKAAWVSITQETLRTYNMDIRTVAGFSNFFAQLLDVDVTVLFYELTDGTSKASLRSKKADVCTLANRFGGGGHTNASGITSDMPFTELVSRVTKALEEL